jgi:hypothetical protein
MIEIVRQIVLLTCLLAAIASALVPEPALLAVRPVDFAADQKRLPRLLTVDESLEEFVARRTEDRVIQVEGSEWAAFFQAVADAAGGQPSTADWSARLGAEFGYSRDVFFRPHEPPLYAVTGGLDDNRPFVYLLLYQRNQAQYLGVNYERPRDASHYAPTWLMYPYRHFSLWVLLAGVAIYVLLPRRRHPKGAAVYSRFHAVIMPDVLGCLLAGTFFAIPLFVVPANAPAADQMFSWEDGWAVLTAICWLLTLLGAFILAWAAWYAGYEILILPDRLQVTTLWRMQEYLYEAMTGVKKPAIRKSSGWLSCLVLLFALLMPAAAGSVEALQSTEQNDILVECRDGRRLRIRSMALQGLGRVLKSLKQAGVPGEYACLPKGD